MLELAPSNWAYQHLNRDGERRTLCGTRFEDPRMKGVSVYDEKDGFDPRKGPACQQCAELADRRQSG